MLLIQLMRSERATHGVVEYVVRKEAITVNFAAIEATMLPLSCAVAVTPIMSSQTAIKCGVKAQKLRTQDLPLSCP